MRNIFILSLWLCFHVWSLVMSMLVVLKSTLSSYYFSVSATLVLCSIFLTVNFITLFNPFQKDAKKLYKRITHLQSEPNQPKYSHVGLFRNRVDLVDHYGKKLEDIEENMRLERSEVSLATQVCACSCCFSFCHLFYFQTFLRIL